jgi:hypothetical protein
MKDDNLAAEEQQINSKAEEASEENTPTESPTVEQTTEEVPEVKEEAAAETKPDETETAESKKGASSRIKELNTKAKAAEERAVQAEEKAKSLSDRLAEITDPIGLPTQQESTQFPYQEGQQITPESYAADVTKVANAAVDIKIAQNNASNRIRNESLDAVRKYPQLDPEKPESFNQELSDSITEATEHYIRVNPYKANVTQFVDKLMKPYLGAVTQEVGKTTENIAKQVSETALRPTSVRQPEKPASELTVAELEQKLGVVQT